MSSDYKIEVIFDKTGEVVKRLEYSTMRARDDAMKRLVMTMNLGEYTAYNINPEPVMSSEEITLKPCPFCGEEAEIQRYGTSRVSTIVTCRGCGTSKECGEEFNHGRDWNDRTEAGIIEQLEEENKRLRDALKAYSFYSESHPMDNYISIRVDIHERAQDALKGE